MDTSASLLDELRSPANEQAWSQLVELYQPLIFGWLRRLGASSSDHDDLAQEVLTVVVRRIDEFQRQPRVGAFRGWLRSITTNCLRNHWKRSGRRPTAKGGSGFAAILDELEDPQSGMSQQWDQEHDQFVLQYLLRRIQSDFSENTWSAFRLFALQGRPAEQVAETLGMTANAVFIAKSRVMARLKSCGQGLLDF